MYPRHDLVNVWKWKRVDAPEQAAPPARALKGAPPTQPTAPIQPKATPPQQQVPPAPAPPQADADGWITPTKRRTTRVTKPVEQAQEPLRRSTRVPGLAAQEISVAEVVMSALERTEATPAAAQAIIDNMMGDAAPESQKGDSVVTKLARVTDIAFNWQVDHGLLDSYGDEVNVVQVEYTAESGEKALLDDIVFKMLVSDAAGRTRTKTKADVSSAYTNAKTTRGKRFLRCPATCPQFDEDGTPLVLELGPPLFGEPEAGYEWQVTLEADLKEFGWTKVENVECLWRLKTAKSDALLGTIVDDLLFTESTGYDISDATIAFLRKKYSGVKAEHEPTSFAGYKIETSKDLSVCTLSMPDLIEEKMKEHLPELITAKAYFALNWRRRLRRTTPRGPLPST